MRPRFCPTLTAALAQLVRALDCDSRGRGFESRRPPHFSASVRACSAIIGHHWSQEPRHAHIIQMSTIRDDPLIPQFGIAWFYGDACVDGRNYSCDIRVGTHFTELVELTRTVGKDSSGAINIESQEVRRIPIDCLVIDIEAYRHHFNCLSGGLTARLTLEGPSLAQLALIIPRQDTDRCFVLRAPKMSPSETSA
jgi:hypothetical protein